jgi:hypothetical protein
MPTFYGIISDCARGCTTDPVLSANSHRLFDSLVDMADMLTSEKCPDAEAVASFNQLCGDLCRYLVGKTGQRLCQAWPCNHASCPRATTFPEH